MITKDDIISNLDSWHQAKVKCLLLGIVMIIERIWPEKWGNDVWIEIANI